MIFKVVNDNSIIDKIWISQAYTYGPLLWPLFFWHFYQAAAPNSFAVTLVCLSCTCTFLYSQYECQNMVWWLPSRDELLLINGLLTFLGLLFISGKAIQGGVYK
jgi:hypothetical protein